MKKIKESTRDTAAYRDLSKRIRKVRLVIFDFDGVFTDNTVYVFEDGREAVQCNRFDGIGLKKLKSLGIEPLVLSTEINPVVSARCRKLGIACLQNTHDKFTVLKRIVGERHLTLEETAFVGNDINDLECLISVGFPVVVKDGHKAVLKYARYTTRLPGGHGAVREVCDLFECVLTGKSGLLSA